MSIEGDILEMKAILLEQSEMLRRLCGVRVADEGDDTEYGAMAAAKYCGVSAPTFRLYVEQTGISGHKPDGGGFTYWLKSELDTIIRIKGLNRKKKLLTHINTQQ